MEHSPYEPPKSAVEDRLKVIPPRPTQISLAIRILWLGFIAGLLSLHPWLRGTWWVNPGETTSAAASLAVVIALTLVFSAFFIWLLVRAGRRKNWARWVLLVYLVIGWISVAIDLPETLSATPFAGAIDFLVAMAELWASYLLFLSPGASWFKREQSS